MRGRDCVIISSDFDYHACAIRYAICAAGGACEILDTGKLIHNARPEASISISDGTLELSGVVTASHSRAIWARRMLKIKDLSAIDSKYAGYVCNEARDFEQNLFSLLEREKDTCWINKPTSVLASEVKSLQLVVAARCGLDVPETLITASPDLVRGFAKQFDYMVIKPFRPHSWQDDAVGKKWTTFANKVKPSELAECDDASLSAAPCIYQEYVSTVADIRVGAIGRKVFALEMRHKEVGKIDFRTMDDGELLFRECVVPEDVLESLQRLMEELSIEIASADFILDNEGQWRFIELNPSGAFLFLEDRCPNIKMLSAAASFLSYGTVGPGYDREFPDLESFIGSPDYTKWLADWKNFDAVNRRAGNITYLNEA